MERMAQKESECAQEKTEGMGNVRECSLIDCIRRHSRIFLSESRWSSRRASPVNSNRMCAL